MRASDWIGRYGGEEFCVVMPNTGRDGAEPILSRIRQAVEQAEFRSTTGELVRMTLSIGAATASFSDDSHIELLDRASGQALIAKRSGRNQLCYSD